jgi:hypothetical protein
VTANSGALALTLPPAPAMRSIRRFSQFLLTALGASIVFYAVYVVELTRDRLLYAGLGVVIMEIGIWQVTTFLFPNERAFKPLRKETDYFLKLVRRMNRAAVASMRGSENAAEEMDRVQQEMYHSIERMRQLAGQTHTAEAASRDAARVGKALPTS